MTNPIDTITIVKRHIQNLIAGHNITRGEMMEMYREITREQVKKRVEQLFKANNIQQTIDKIVNSTIKSHLNDLMNKDRGHWASNKTRIEDMVHEECQRQVEKIIRENFTVTLNGANQFQEK